MKALSILLLASVCALGQKPLTVTIEGVGQDLKQKTFLTCDAIGGKFQHCVLAEGVTLDDLAFWNGYSAKVVNDVLRDLKKQNAHLRAQLKKEGSARAGKE